MNWLGKAALLSVVIPAISFADVSLRKMSVTQQEKSIQVAFQLSNETSYRIMRLSGPPRIAIDFTDTRLATTLPKVSSAIPEINLIRYGQFNPHQYRIVLDLPKSTPIIRSGMTKTKNGALLVLQLKSSGNASKVAEKSSDTKTVNLASNQINPVNLANAKKNKIFTVVIDPGHGGKDPGATGANGAKEKDIVLNVARALKNEINRNPRMHAVLTRDGDYYLTLRERLRVARNNKADLFIAVHADAFPNVKASGSSVFVLSANGASSEAARWIAKKENNSELGGITLADKDDILRSMLIDLSQAATINTSLDVGNKVLKKLSSVSPLHYDTVEQAPFVVLKSPDIASLLIETGFISNADEEKRLQDPTYQRKLAAAIADGIKKEGMA